jgi:chorismate dehydratase
LRIGCVKYLNARPLIHGWPGAVTLDHPAALCRRLSAGELEVALVSSFEFLRNSIYRVVDGISISSDGPVYSVVVAHRSEKSLSAIELDPASQTSVALLHYLMSRRGQQFVAAELTTDVLSPLGNRRSRLLIGDQAIRFRQIFGSAYDYWDLGEEWKRLTGLPFVYALWLVRPELSGAATLGGRLRGLRDINLRQLDDIIGQEKEFDPEFCRRYYRDNLRFSFEEREKQGLQEFANVCTSLGLIPNPELALELV